ncbi:MAG: phosphoribosylformylglycinamidine synthase subunit PurS [Candidatus Doudnabacteria bacterium]
MAKAGRGVVQKPRQVLVQMLVRYKPEVPDPEKADMLVRLTNQGYHQVAGVALAKLFLIRFEDITPKKARAAAEKIGSDMLANPVTEDFEIISVETIKT